MLDDIPEVIPHPSFEQFLTGAGLNLIKQKEDILVKYAAMLGLTEDEFVQQYYIEEYPMEIEQQQDIPTQQITFRIIETFRIKKIEE